MPIEVNPEVVEACASGLDGLDWRFGKRILPLKNEDNVGVAAYRQYDAQLLMQAAVLRLGKLCECTGAFLRNAEQSVREEDEALAQALEGTP